MVRHPDRLLSQVRQLAAADAADAALLGRYVAARDEAAFAALVSRHAGLVLGVCRRIVHDPASAEDVAQAAFLLLARRAAHLRRPEAVATWLHQTARTLAMKHLRAAARRRRHEAAVPPRQTADPLDEISVREFLRILDDEVARLPEQHRLPLLLCGLEGCSIADAARRLGWSPGAVKGRLERGRAALRDQLERRGLRLPTALVEAGAVPAGFVARVTGPASPAVVAIAEEGLRGMTMVKAKVGLAAAVVVLTAGVLASAIGGGSAPPADAKPKAKAMVDRHGDPLPPGAVARLGTTRWRVPGEIRSLALSADAKSVVAISPAGVTVFDRDGRRAKQLRSPDTYYSHLVPLPDGKHVACLGTAVRGDQEKKVVHVWHLADGWIVREIDAKGIQWLDVTAAGEPLGVFFARDEVRLRELATGKETRLTAKNLPKPWLEYGACAYAPKGKVLAMFDEEQQLHVWDVAADTKKHTFDMKGKSVRSLTLSPDGKALAAYTPEGNKRPTIFLWDLGTGKVAHTIPGEKYLHTLALAPDGATLAAVGWYDVRFHDVATGRELRRAKGVVSFGPHVAFSRDGSTLATMEQHGGTVHLWDAATAARKPAPDGHTHAAWRIAVSADGSRVASCDVFDKDVFVWDPATGERVLHVAGGKDYVRDCGFAAGRLLACLGATVEGRDAAGGRLVDTLKLADPDRPNVAEEGLTLHVGDDGKTVVALSQSSPGANGPMTDLLVTGWDAGSGKLLFHRRRGRPAFDAVVSPDLTALAVPAGGPNTKEGQGAGPVRVEGLRTGERLLAIEPVDGQTQGWPERFTPDSRLLATHVNRFAQDTNSRHLVLWELASGGEVARFPNCSNGKVAFSPDGRLMALTPTNQVVQLWDLRRGREVTRLTGFDADVVSLAFAPDGRRLVSGLADTSILVWAVPAVPKAAALDAAGVAKAWADLGGDAAAAFKARGALADARAVGWLKERVTPVPAVAAAEVRRLLADLDGDTAAVRQAAKAKLEELGDRAGDALRAALAANPSAEVKRQAEALLGRLRGLVKEVELLRSLRAVAVLEDIGTPESRKILEAVAAGAPAARLTVAATAALVRLAGRPR